MREMRLPLCLSVAFHGSMAALLLALALTAAPRQLTLPPHPTIQVSLVPAVPEPPTAELPPAEPAAPPEPPEAMTELPPAPSIAEPQPIPAPPPPAPIPEPQPKKPAPRPRPARIAPAPERPVPVETPASPQTPPQTATAALSVPAPAPAAPTISAAYRSALGAWLETHKRYPDSARERGEEGRAVLRFRVNRSGRVLDYAVVRSTGYADLDAALGTMMRGATLPPFPADMTAPQIEVTLTIRFGLSR